MADAILAAVTVEASVIVPVATIRGSEICRSLIDEDTTIGALSPSGVVIGAHTQITAD